MTPSDALAQARRHLRAAGALYRDGLMPECHAEMVRALDATLSAWTLVAGAPGTAVAAAGTTEAEGAAASATEHPALAVLAARGYDVAHLRTLLAAGAAAADPQSLPRAFEATWAEAERLVRFTSRQLRSPQERRRRRNTAAACVLAALLVAAVVCLRLWGRVRARASATYSPEFPAAYAVDGIDSTEWMLPDATLGWLDVYLPRPTDVARVAVSNGHNRFFLDRATRRVRVTAYDGDRELASSVLEFPGIKDGHNLREVKLRARGATRIHLDVLSFYGAGAAIAEVEVR